MHPALLEFRLQLLPVTDRFLGLARPPHLGALVQPVERVAEHHHLGVAHKDVLHLAAAKILPRAGAGQQRLLRARHLEGVLSVAPRLQLLEVARGAPLVPLEHVERGEREPLRPQVEAVVLVELGLLAGELWIALAGEAQLLGRLAYAHGAVVAVLGGALGDEVEGAHAAEVGGARALEVGSAHQVGGAYQVGCAHQVNRAGALLLDLQLRQGRGAGEERAGLDAARDPAHPGGCSPRGGMEMRWREARAAQRFEPKPT
mmetsp:Transcript_40347/g.113089  ORF Transcript_40347/g.113089 Transcript_40347/m.113089 type:complete len:259 (-) Transcript_40347:2-778(-)